LGSYGEQRQECNAILERWTVCCGRRGWESTSLRTQEQPEQRISTAIGIPVLDNARKLASVIVGDLTYGWYRANRKAFGREKKVLRYTFGVNLPPILLGTSSFTASGWAGSFYPKGMRPADHLGFYAEHFETVEVDSTFYACPSAQTVSNWAARTPEGFIFSVKILSSWVDFCYQVRKRGVVIYAYANNHFSGHAPATIEQFRDIWQGKGFPDLTRPQPAYRQPTLFRT
jgi:hypothetical protein